MREGGDDHNLLVQQYPIELTQRAFHQPRHRRHSSRKRLGHRPMWPIYQYIIPSNVCTIISVGWSYRKKYWRGVVEAAQGCRIDRVVKSGRRAYLWESSFGEYTSPVLAWQYLIRSIWHAGPWCMMGTYINKQVLPQAPSPTMTSFRRISAIVTVERWEWCRGRLDQENCWDVVFVVDSCDIVDGNSLFDQERLRARCFSKSSLGWGEMAAA